MLAPHLFTLARTPCQEVLMYLRDSPAWVTGVGAHELLGTVMITYQRKIMSYLLHFNVMLFLGKLVTFTFRILFTPVRVTRTPYFFRMPVTDKVVIHPWPKNDALAGKAFLSHQEQHWEGHE